MPSQPGYRPRPVLGVAFSLEEGDVFGLISHRKLRCSFLARSYKSCVGVAPRQDRGLTLTMRVCAIKCNFVPLPPPAHQWMEGSVWWSQRSRGPSEFFKVPPSPNCRCPSTTGGPRGNRQAAKAVRLWRVERGAALGSMRGGRVRL